MINDELLSPHVDTRLKVAGDGADIRVLLFVQEGAAKQMYLDALSECGVQVFVSTSFFDLTDEICSNTYHGLLIDVPAKMKAIKENRAYVYRLVERFPVSHLQMDMGSGEVRCYHVNRKFGGTLLDFINNQCRTFIPQKIRRDAREEVHLPVLVYKHQDDKRPERSITEDLSLGGCFIISSRRWKEGQDVWIRFKDISDPLPIRVSIHRVVKWGKPGQIPGIGVQFKDLSPLQNAELANFFFKLDAPK
ncbi:MAG: PilZ domain-containing protein [Proteobacteria bacterium]|nr:PilZ domain-containing protein [Pseudomonadota bacterium]